MLSSWTPSGRACTPLRAAGTGACEAGAAAGFGVGVGRGHDATVGRCGRPFARRVVELELRRHCAYNLWRYWRRAADVNHDLRRAIVGAGRLQLEDGAVRLQLGNVGVVGL